MEEETRGETGRRGQRREAGLFFMSCPSVYDTVAINKKSSEERLFIRFSQSVTIKQPVKS